MKILTVVGTRPEIIKLSMVLKRLDKVSDHILVHTGQNFDKELNENFFEDLDLKSPKYYLDAAEKSSVLTISKTLSKVDEVLEKEKPDAFVIYGDTNSCLSVIAAKKRKIPIFHMEAGNRCFDQNVPEELNRKIADHTSDINLTYTENSRRYLLAEGFRKDHVFCVGSPLKEVLDFYSDQINGSLILEKLQLNKEKYIVASIHREENLDIGDNFKNIIDALNKVVDLYDAQLIFSTHPRTKKKIEQLNLKVSSRISFVEPLGFCDYVFLQKNALITLSDSGTISEESTILGFKALSIRTSTERPEAIDHGNIILGGITTENIINSINITLGLKDQPDPPVEYLKADNSNTVLKLIQSYTPIINRETWRK